MQFEHPAFRCTPSETYVPVSRCLSPRISKLQGRWESPTAEGPQAKVGMNRQAATSWICKPSLASADDGPRKFSQEANKTWKMNNEATCKSPTSVVQAVTSKPLLRPAKTKRNNDAAAVIQKMMRGWWQRLKFRITLLQHKLDTKQQRTEDSIGRVKERTMKQKAAFRKKMKNEMERSSALDEATKEAQAVIAFLRGENKKLREKNQKIAEAAQTLRIQNAQLENAATHVDASFGTLNGHAKQIEETHKKLASITPKYEASVATMEDAVQVRQQYCLSEHTIKVMYLKAIGKIAEMMEEKSDQDELISEVVDACLALEDMEHCIEPPPELLSKDEVQESSDSEDYDEYTVASYD